MPKKFSPLEVLLFWIRPKSFFCVLDKASVRRFNCFCLLLMVMVPLPIIWSIFIGGNDSFAYVSDKSIRETVWLILFFSMLFSFLILGFVFLTGAGMYRVDLRAIERMEVSVRRSELEELKKISREQGYVLNIQCTAARVLSGINEWNSTASSIKREWGLGGAEEGEEPAAMDLPERIQVGEKIVVHGNDIIFEGLQIAQHLNLTRWEKGSYPGEKAGTVSRVDGAGKGIIVVFEIDGREYLTRPQHCQRVPQSYQLDADN